MTDRNAPCPCGSGKKFKKCHGAGGAAAASSAPSAATSRASAPPGPAAHPAGEAPSGVEASPANDEKPFLVHTGRGLESERAEAERKKHMRRRIQTTDLKGTLVYNSGAFFRPPNP